MLFTAIGHCLGSVLPVLHARGDPVQPPAFSESMGQI